MPSLTSKAGIDYLQIHCVALHSLRLQDSEVKNKLKSTILKRDKELARFPS